MEAKQRRSCKVHNGSHCVKSRDMLTLDVFTLDVFLGSKTAGQNATEDWVSQNNCKSLTSIKLDTSS